MQAKHSLLIVDDHTILRQGIKAILRAQTRYNVVGEARDGLEAIQRVCELRPSLVITDLTMPRMNGIEAIREIKAIAPATRIVVLTAQNTEEYIFACLQAGADSYVLKDADSSELLLAIESALKGQRFLSPAVAERVVQSYLNGGHPENLGPSWNTLTRRERETLKLIAEGYKNREIGSLLRISPKTVEKHRENLMKKLDLHSVSALTAFAIEHGLLECHPASLA